MNLAPILISSPVRRSGTTLLQRLLCSANNTLIYGENCANDLNFSAMFISNKALLYNSSQDQRNELLQQVLAGDTKQWIPDLMPEILGYLEAYRAANLKIVEHYANYAQQQGRTVWGAKMPEWNPANLAQVLQLLPQAKLIYLHRPLAPCVASAKSIDMVQTEQEVQQFCHTWKQFGNYVQANFKGDRVLHISYDELLAKPQEIIHQLETFTGAKAISTTVLQTKVNTYANDQRLATDAPAYLQPTGLNAKEEEIVKAYTD